MTSTAAACPSGCRGGRSKAWGPSMWGPTRSSYYVYNSRILMVFWVPRVGQKGCALPAAILRGGKASRTRSPGIVQPSGRSSAPHQARLVAGEGRPVGTHFSARCQSQPPFCSCFLNRTKLHDKAGRARRQTHSFWWEERRHGGAGQLENSCFDGSPALYPMCLLFP